MASKKVGDDEIDLDNMSFDDNFDFDIPDFEDASEKANSRTPVENLSENFKESFKSHLTSPENVKNAVGKALPRGYGQAINVYDNVSDTAQELYHSVTTDIKPLTDGLRIAAGKISPKIKERLPKSLSSKLESFAEGYYNSGPYNAAKFKSDGEEGEIASTITDMFKAQATRDNDEYANEKADDAVRDVIDTKRHKQSLSQTSIVAQGISRLVGYQDQVLAKWQQKTLELQYRQYFVAKDLLEVTNVNTQKIVDALGKVVVNTALPEAVKIHKSELAAQMLKERLISNTFKTAANYSRDFREKLTKNVKDMVGGFSGQLGSAAGAMDAMDAQGGIVASAGSMAGRGLAEKLTNYGAGKLAPHIAKFQGVRRLGAKVGNFLNNIPGEANEYAKSETTRTGFFGGLEDVGKALIPTHTLDDKIASSNILDSDRPATFDNLTRRSIVEVIPGWLAQINRWTKAAATGKIDKEKDMDVYNLAQGKFTTNETYLKDMKRTINNNQEDDSTKRQLDGFVDSLEGENKKLSPAARKALKKKIVTDTAHHRKFSPAELSKRQHYDGLSEEDITSITELIKDKFSLDFDGVADPSVENEDMRDNFNSAYNSILNTLPNTGDRVRILHSVFGASNLEKLGMSTRENNQDSIRYDNIFNELAGGETTEVSGFDEHGGPAAKRKRIQRPPAPAPAPIPLPVQESSSAGTGCDPCESNETYLGKDSALLELLRALQGDVQASNVSELVAQSTSILGEIALRVNSINTGVPIPESEQRKDANWLYSKTKNGIKRGGTFSKDLAKSYFKKTMTFYRSVGTAGLWTGKLGFKGIKATVLGIGNTLLEKAKPAGVYIKGTLDGLKPKLTQAGIDGKEYWDVNSQKFVKKLSDITGEVLGPDGLPVLTAEEYAKGLVTETGKVLRTKISDLITGAGKLGFRIGTAPYKAAWTIAKNIAGGIFTQARDTMDLHLKGENIARLRKTLMEKGDEYFDLVTGDPIKTIADIKGAVKDKFGDIVVSLEDIKNSKGFWSSTGKAVKTGGLKIINALIAGAKLYGKAVMLPFRALKWAGTKLKNGLKRMAKGFSFSSSWNSSGDNKNDMVTLAHAQLAVQEQMLSFIRDRFAKKKAIAGDADGDGDRDGSIKDMLANRKARLAEAAAARAAAAGGSGSKDKTKEGEEGEGEGMSAAKAGLVGAAGAAAWGMAKTGASKAASWVGKKIGGQAIKQGLMTAGRFIGKQVLWRGAQMAGTALVGILGAPVVLGAMAVAAVGYGAYKLYKHIADKPTPLIGMRYAQYGINPREAEQIAPIAQLEAMFVKNTSISSDNAITISKSGMDAQAIFTLFGIDTKNEDNLERMNNLTLWIAKRFMPVYNAHAVAINSLAKGVTLADIDKDLPIQQGLAFVKATRLDSLEDVYDDTDISPFEDELDSDSDTVIKWVEDAINIFNVKLSALPEDQKGDKVADAIKPVAEVAAGAAAAAATASAANSPTIKKLDGSDQPSAFSKVLGGAYALADNSTVKAAALLAIPGMGAMMAAWGGLSEISGRLSGKNNRPKVTLDALTAGRYKAYGLVELDLDKVEALYSLEEAMYTDVFYDADKVANFMGKADAIYPLVRTLFKIDDDDTEHRTNWFMWYKFRYLPVFTQFCTSVRSKSAINAADAPTKLSLDQQHEVLVETSAARVNWSGNEVSIWTVPVSPWKKYVLNMQEDSIAGNIEALKTAGKREGLKDTSKTVTNPKTEIEMAKRQEAMNSDGSPRAPGSEDGDDEPGFFSKTMSKFFGSKGPDGQRSGGYFGGEGSATKIYDANAKALNGGAVIQSHPGGGTGGDINAIPSPTGKGWAAAKDTLIAAANMVGFDAATAATVVAVESGFDPGIKAPTSSAGGYFQFIDSTWTATLKKHGAKYGLAADASKYDGRANALMGMEFLKENQEYLEKTVTDRPVADTDLYAAHFLGPAGAKRFLSAPPGSDARQAVGDGVPRANHNIFYDQKNNARTVSGVYEKFNELLVSKRKMHDLKPGETVAVEKVDETGTLLGNAAGQPVSTDGTTSTPIPTQGGEVAAAGPIGIMPMSTGGGAPAVAAPIGIMPMSASAPVETKQGPQSTVLMQQGKDSATAQGIQPVASSGLAKPATLDDDVGDVPSPVALAAIAQKQSSTESASLTTSIGSVKDIMSEQLMVQSSMDGKLSLILEELKVRQEQEQKDSGVRPVTTPPSRPASNTSAGSKPLGNVPISTSRQHAT
jgi:hypothetical protein